MARTTYPALTKSPRSISAALTRAERNAGLPPLSTHQSYAREFADVNRATVRTKAVAPRTTLEHGWADAMWSGIVAPASTGASSCEPNADRGGAHFAGGPRRCGVESMPAVDWSAIPTRAQRRSRSQDAGSPCSLILTWGRGWPPIGRSPRGGVRPDSAAPLRAGSSLCSFQAIRPTFFNLRGPECDLSLSIWGPVPTTPRARPAPGSRTSA